MIPFNKPYMTGQELGYIEQVMRSGKISGDGDFTHQCQDFFNETFGFSKTLLTTSCTDALELAALLLNIGPGDEVIAPSYTFVSTVNAFVLRGAKIVFADSRPDMPGIDEESIESLITPKTKAVVPVHYAGVACDMDKILGLADRYKLYVVEDAAQAVDSYYKGKSLGGIGHLGTFSFHETKNITSGEGGLLAVNDMRFADRAEIIREKGTNRSAFFRGEVNKYGWVDIGSSFLPSDINAAFLYAQLEHLEEIQAKRIAIWERYYNNLKELALNGCISLPYIPEYASNNAHMFYVLCANLRMRSSLMCFLKERGISSVFHYLPLHKSEYYMPKYTGNELPNADLYTDRLLRLPLYFELTFAEVDLICDSIYDWSKTL
ncbi:TDP-4-keto-6-deoxy-D-glucose transaminase [Denitrovibrio acetiphilus DSM 12809]|uniref:TDP-4-keto-6-deoxy-D-glucose transaminase n=1 Tax=Denitrovibrio acetiphilus (strain DSM 12809 / NBRC 114555 / N2460) TaxID=522772 RepID=D4H5U2_DENA2|nr:dTDP-4-amino-4,6-dideoxygalactose transaminase [Denitrovibrio acetiphilus]ADD69533.1 TDP-4-keto-6-deoxy-D-glucose transaminase [Denitrovibrio acetiphilus DSM 12809]